jgi:hypothetical protein
MLWGVLIKVSLWMRSRRLQLNVDKTDLISFTTSRWQRQLPIDGMVIGGHVITPNCLFVTLASFLTLTSA